MEVSEEVKKKANDWAYQCLISNDDRFDIGKNSYIQGYQQTCVDKDAEISRLKEEIEKLKPQLD